MFRRISRLLTWNPLATFVIMAGAFALFSLITLEMFQMLSANLALVSREGWMALMHGGARQLAELALSLMVALASYLVFKACERVLVERMTAR